MLEIDISETEMWDESSEQFIRVRPQKLVLEHSLISLNKWESKYMKPFLNSEKSGEELLDYIKCMTMTPNIDDSVYRCLTSDDIIKINDYINHPMTATTFHDQGKRGGGEKVVTAELIYYWMIALQIPFECQKWHLNKLLTLIRVCNIKSQPPKKMSKNQIMSRNQALNKARRAKLNSKG